MLSLKTFWVLAIFYVVAKVSFFTGVYIVTKAIERRALRDKRKRFETHRLFELESLTQKRDFERQSYLKDREIFGMRYRRFVS